MAAAAGVEPATCSLGESRSIQLSYATAFCIFLESSSSEKHLRNTWKKERFASVGKSNPLRLDLS